MIISIASQKGGVSKTTTAISLAAGLAHHGRQVLLIDIDNQANSSKVLLDDFQQVRAEQSIYATIIERKPLPIRPSSIPNLDIVPRTFSCPTPMRAAEDRQPAADVTGTYGDTAAPVDHHEENSVGSAAPTCPRCGSEMKLRTAKKGENQGQQFWSCSNFPRCRTLLSYEPATA